MIGLFQNSSIQFGRIETSPHPKTYFDQGVKKYFCPGTYFDFGYWNILSPKYQTRKTLKIDKDF